MPLSMGMPIGSPWVLLLLLRSRSVLVSVEASVATGAGESIACKTQPLICQYISHTPDFRSPSTLISNISTTLRNYFRTIVLLESILLYHLRLSICTLIIIQLSPSPQMLHVLFFPISPSSPHERSVDVSFMLSDLLSTK